MLGGALKNIVKEQLKTILKEIEQEGKRFKIVIEIESEELEEDGA